ncbi:MAG: hypothetical protein HC837_14255 [Chloroflexaceae bacterium]|nr:hypothetical protein [Chloroflexaceae bacterium]
MVAGRKGHLPKATQLPLVAEVQRIVPDWAEVSFLSDGEFDGVTLQTAVDASGGQHE